MQRILLSSMLAVAMLIAPVAEAAPKRAVIGPVAPWILTWIRPNLICESIEVTELDGWLADIPQVTVKLKNNGYLPSGPFGAHCWLNIDGKHSLKLWWTTTGLAPGQTATWTMTLSKSWVPPTGIQHYAVKVDVDLLDHVTESNENDNTTQVIVDM